MFDLFLVMAASASPITPTGVSVTSIGNSLAKTCYESAEARAASDSTIDECSEALNGALSQSDRIATFVNRGILKLISKDHAGAEADFDYAIALQPTQAEAWLNKGVSLYQRGDNQSAIALLGRSIELRTVRPALAFYARALANEESGNIRAAYADLTKARELAPRWTVPVAELARYQVRRR